MTTLENDIARESAGVGDRVEWVAAALRSHNIEAIVVDTGQGAREVVLGLIPDRSEVHSGKSKTLEDVGLFSELVVSGRVAASAIGNQLGPYAAGAGRVILIIGSQKIVPDLDAALRRIHDVVFPYENAQVQARMGVDTALDKVLVIYGERRAGRTTVVLVRQPVGI